MKANLNEPQLDKPGAGVPFFQELAMRLYVGPFVAGQADWDEVDDNFQKLNEKIRKLVGNTPADRLTKRALVPPQKGLEDSSRYWSVAMCLEHLALVGGHMKTIIIELSHGRVPPVRVDTAAVKPKGEMTGKQAIQVFTKFAETVVSELNAKVKDRKSRAKLKHPWFGPFTAQQWHWLLVGHTLVHYQQIKAILSATSAAS